jgi:hypothetical protein
MDTTKMTLTHMSIAGEYWDVKTALLVVCCCFVFVFSVLFFLWIHRHVECVFFWKVIAFVDAQLSLRFDAAPLACVLAPD